MVPQRTPSVLLFDHHSTIEGICRVLRSYACGGDPQELIAAYRRFEAAIVTHMEAEEELLLPTYGEDFPATARRIREEHEALRRCMLQIAVDVELHAVRVEQIDQLLDLLRAHAEYEDLTLYRWANAQLIVEATISLAARIDGSIPPGAGSDIAARVEHTGYSR